jgi:rhodanese-related sulfurtransferase
MRWMIFMMLVLALGACSGAVQTGSLTPVVVKVAGGSYTNATPALLQQMLAKKDFVFINVHIPYEGEITPTDAFIPYDQVEQNLAKFPADKNAKIFLYCRSGRMSAMAAEELIKRGYTNVWNLDGGMVAWESAGLPLKLK